MTLQGLHSLWRGRAIDAWTRAGVRAGDTVLDLGCGPGLATADLAHLVGLAGLVIAVDRSRAALDAAASCARDANAPSRLVLVESAIDDVDPAEWRPDVVWCRWVMAGVGDVFAMATRIRSALRPGGVVISHEFLEAGEWRLAAPAPELDALPALLSAHRPADGVGVETGLEFAGSIAQAGFAAAAVSPISLTGRPEDLVWQWPRVVVETGLARLVAASVISHPTASAILDAWQLRERAPRVSSEPALLEVIARVPHELPHTA